MWGWGGGTKKSADAPRTTKKASADPYADDFNFEEPDITDADLDDPALLAELQRLARGLGDASSKEAKTPKKQTGGATAVDKPQRKAPASQTKPAALTSAPVSGDDVDVDALVSTLPLGEEDVEVAFDESDMNDPDLLAALTALSGSQGELGATSVSSMSLEEKGPAGTTASFSQEVIVTVTGGDTLSDQDELSSDQAQQDTTAIVEKDETVPLEYKLRCSDPTVLSKYVQLEKIKAVNKKRAGDKEGALQSLRASKALEQRYQEVNDAIEAKIMPPAHVPTSSTLNELSPPSASSSGGRHDHIKTEEPFSNDEDSTQTVTTSSAAIAEPSIAPAQPDSDDTLQLLMKRQLEYKQSALQAKKANNLPRARELVAVSKLIQEPIESLSLGGTLPDGYKIPPPPSEYQAPTTAAPNTPNSKAAPSSTSNSPVARPDKAASPAIKGQPAGKSTVRLGVAIRESVDFNDVSAFSPSTLTVTATGSSPMAPASNADLFAHLQTMLETQVAQCTTIAAHYYKQNKRTEALTFHKWKKNFLSDLETLRLLQSASDARVPVFRYTTMKYEIEQAIPEVAPDEMELQIVRAWDLRTREIKSEDVESFVVFDLAWPPEDMEGANAGDGRGETGTVKKTGEPEYRYEKRVKIARNRTFQRYLERRKASFEVFHYQRGFLLTGKKISLGKASIKMESLLTKCEIHEVAELMDPNNPRRATGGKLEIKIRLRSPLAKPDVVVKEDRWLVIDFGGTASAVGTGVPDGISLPASSPGQSATGTVPTISVDGVQKSHKPTKSRDGSVSPSPSKLSLEPAPAGSAKPVSPAVSSASLSIPSPATTPQRQPSPLPPAAGKKPSSTQLQSPTHPVTAGVTPSADADDLYDLEMQFLSPDGIVSNAVLEQEHNQIVQQITALQASRKPVPDDLTDRKQAYEIRMNLLVTMVQMGTLTMENYIAEVKESMQQTKQTALTFKKAGKIELAKQALSRLKLMTGEVEEVEREMG